MATTCPHCSYDFPQQSVDMKPNRGLAYSAIADIALVVGIMCTLLGALISLVAAVQLLLVGNFSNALSCMLAFFILLAQYVVFQRVGDRG